MNDGPRAEPALSAELAGSLRRVIAALQEQLEELDRLGVSQGAGDLDLAICRLEAFAAPPSQGPGQDAGKAASHLLKMGFQRPPG